MDALPELLGESPAIEAVRQSVRRLLVRSQTGRRLPALLIGGETGTGKGHVARLIHRHGPRARGPFVDVNCAAIPDNLLEAELFGFERGAFTDARRAKPGLFQTAHRGTIFLDEIGLLPEALQAKLLKVIEEQAVRRLGGNRSEPIDVAVISATNADLKTAIATRRFREDLYHRLAVLTLDMPPLRERGRDIILLARHYLALTCTEYGLSHKRLTPDAESRLLRHPWPGNIRELTNLIERVALLGEDDVIEEDMLELQDRPRHAPDNAGAVPVPLANIMRDQLVTALEQTKWNISHTATQLGISRNTVRSRIERFGLAPGEARRVTARVPLPSAPRAAPPLVASARGETPLTVRWEQRSVTFLRATLITPEDTDDFLETNRAVDVLMEKARSFGGTVEEIGVRGIGAVFGLEPVEDAPRRAAHAAMAIQKAAERGRQDDGKGFAVKTGIHVGMVLIVRSSMGTKIDSEARREHWKTLDLALEQGAPGRTFVTYAATPLLERRFDLAPTDDAPAPAYLLLGRERKGLSPEGHMAPFVGRGPELEILQSRLAAARTGSTQIAVITGEAGIGKSRLLHEFRQTLRGEPITYLEGHCVSYGSTIPYLPIIEVLRRGCRVVDADTPAQVVQKLRVTLALLGMDSDETVLHLTRFMGFKEGTESLGGPTPEALRTRTSQILRQMCLNASRQRPLVMVIEDLHWVDPASESLGTMGETLGGASLFIILTYRPDYQPSWLDRSWVTHISLQPLSVDESLSVLQGILSTGRLSEVVAREIVDRADGNPFYLEELGRTVSEHGGLPTGGDVPHTVQEVLLARMNRLPERERSVLQSAAAVGRNIPIRLLAAASQLNGSELAASLHQLRAGQFLYETNLDPELEYSFRHSLTHDVAYKSLLPDQRRALHTRIVEAIEQLYPDRLADHAERLADHALLGEVWSKAVDYLRAAGATAFARGDVEECLGRLERALEVTQRLVTTPENLRRAVDVRLDLHGPLIVLGQVARLIRLHEESERLTRDLDDPPRRGQVLWRMSHYSWMDARYQDGIDCATQARQIATGIGNDELRVAATYAAALNWFSLGSYREAMDLFTSIVDGPDADRAKRLLALTIPAYISSCSWLGHSWSFLGNPRRGLEYADRAVAAADAYDHPQAQAIAYTLRALPLLYAGDLHQGVAMAERALELCKTRGLILWFPGASVTFGWALALAGRADEALPHLERGPTIVEAFGSKNFVSLMYTWWAEGLLLAGQVGEAALKIDRAVELARMCQEAGYLTEALHGRAQVLAAADPLDFETAAAAYRQAHHEAERLGQRALAARCLLGLGHLYRQSGEPAQAREHLSNAAALCREMGLSLWLRQAERDLGSP